MNKRLLGAIALIVALLALGGYLSTLVEDEGGPDGDPAMVNGNMDVEVEGQRMPGYELENLGNEPASEETDAADGAVNPETVELDDSPMPEIDLEEGQIELPDYDGETVQDTEEATDEPQE